jgi:parvulin-like peptidyl-prolyl isomerase
MANVLGISLSSQEVVSFLRKNFRLDDIYREIIEQKIIHQVALENGLVVTPEEIEMEIDGIRYQQGFDHPASLMTWLRDRGATLADLQESVSATLLAQKVMRHLFAEQIESRFAEQRSSFDRIVLYKLVVPYEHLAQEIFYQIEEEEISFFEAAHVYDVDEDRRLRCGYEGHLRRRDLSPELAELLFSAKIGELVGPVKAANEFYELFWIDDLIPPDLSPTLHNDMLDQLFQDWMAAQLEAYVANAELPGSSSEPAPGSPPEPPSA